MTEISTKAKGQMRLPMDLFPELDRNFHKGGRSFYFFDFDDNVVHLPTKIVLFHRDTSEEKEVSTSEFALMRNDLGKKDTVWESYEIRMAKNGSYRNFRHHEPEDLQGKEQPMIRDMVEALQSPIGDWRGPSWDFFKHAVDSNRPVSIITARGQHPHTIRRAINMLVQNRELSAHPNYLSVFPLSYPDTVRQLNGDENTSIPELKRRAIIKCVTDAFECYGQSPHHRFGMSDDDAENIELIRSAMVELKSTYSENAFYVISTM